MKIDISAIKIKSQLSLHKVHSTLNGNKFEVSLQMKFLSIIHKSKHS